MTHMAHMEPLPLFYSLNRFLQHDEHIGAGSVEICRAEFLLDVLDDDLGMAAQAKVEGKLDTCGSVSLSHSSHLQQVQSCRKYGLKEVVLTGIGGKSEPLREAGVLHVSAGEGAAGAKHSQEALGQRRQTSDDGELPAWTACHPLRWILGAEDSRAGRRAESSH